MDTSMESCAYDEKTGNAGEGRFFPEGRGTAFVLVLFLLLYLPFVGKAFHIDDLAFINASKMIGWNPLEVIPTDMHFEGILYPKYIVYELSHPLLVSYFIKIVIALFGESEVALHLAFMVFPLVALFSLMKLHRVFFPDAGEMSALPALFLLAMPAFLVNSLNVMTDLPTLAFLLLGMACLFDGLENGSAKMSYLGGISLALSVFCSYQMLAFPPLIFLYALWRRKLTLHTFVGIALPYACLLAWLLAIYAVYDVFPVLKSKVTGTSGDMGGMIKRGFGAEAIFKKGFSALALIGATGIFVLPLHYGLKRIMGRFLLLFTVLLPLSYLATFKITRYSFNASLAFSCFVALGVLTVLTLVWTVWQRAEKGEKTRRDVFLLVWFFCVLGYATLLLPFSAARYILPLFPPMLMLMTSDPAWQAATSGRRIAVWSVLAASLLFGAASAFSDYKYADSYRQFAAKVKQIRSDAGNAFDVWYIGEWGMHYYMDKAGARYLHRDSNEPKAGDYVVLPDMPRMWRPSLPLQYRLSLKGEHRYASWFPLRLFNRRSDAGFYCHAWGMLPFAVSNEPDEVFTVLQVVR